MKFLLKKIIVAIIQLEASLVLRKYKPSVIAITGSVGKTSAKEAVYAVLSRLGQVRRSAGSYNSELGVPLTILGEETAWTSIVGWMKIILNGLKQIFSKRKNFPKTLILEMGVNRPGDISRLKRLMRPNIAIVTAIGEIPAHVEFFSGEEAVAREKSKILKHLGVNDWAILNFDDVAVRAMSEKTRGRVITFGFDDGADVKGSNYQIIYRKDKNKNIPIGISFKVDYKGGTVPIRLHGTFGRHQVYAALVAIAVGVVKNINLVNISEALSLYNSPAGRLKLIVGLKESLILDDTYNSSPQALHAAIDTLRDIPTLSPESENGGRKIAVLGDMLELGKFTIEEHEKVGRRLKGIVDILFVVGPRAKFIAEEARASGFKKENIYEFAGSVRAGRVLQEKMEEGDLILVKGSQAMRMEKVVEEVMERPEEADRTLVRQDKIWKDR